MRTEPADTGGSSSTQLTQVEQEYMGNVAATFGAGVGAAFGMGSTGSSGGGKPDIKFDHDGVHQLIKYFEKVRDEELDTAKRKAHRLTDLKDPGHPEGSLYNFSVRDLGNNYLAYHHKLSDAIDKTIDALRKASAKYLADDQAHAADFSKGASS